MARPSRFTPQTAVALIAAKSRGASDRAVAREVNVPPPTLRLWLQGGMPGCADFAIAYRAAARDARRAKGAALRPKFPPLRSEPARAAA